VATVLAVAFAALYLAGRATSPQEATTYLDEQRPDVAARATEVTQLLTNFDADSIDEASERVDVIATGNFKRDYRSLTGGGLSTALERASASSTGEITNGPEVSFRSASEAIALVEVTQTTRSRLDPEGQTFDYLMKITLVDSDGTWKADRVDVISQRRV
jgi:hypothetical protein